MSIETEMRTMMERTKYIRLVDAITVCQACPLGTAGQGVPGRWTVGPRDELGTEIVMVLGEAPGGVEMAQGKPFVGQSGELLHSLLKEVGLTSYYVSNIAKHQPPKVKGKQQAPDSSSVEACAPFLRAEIEMVKPTKLILLGLTAAKLVCSGRYSAKDVMNQTYEYKGIPTLLLYHPAHFLYNRTAPWIQKAVREWKQSLKLFMGGKVPVYRVERVLCPTHS